MIDKVIVRLGVPITEKELRVEAAKLGAIVKERSLKDRKPYLVVSNGEWQFEVKKKFASPFMNVVQTNPSKYWRSMSDFLGVADSLFFEGFSTALLLRLDLAIDLPIPIVRLLEGLEVKCKRNFVKYDNSGIYFGSRATELICIYDKGTSDQPLSRIEMRYRNSAALPSRNLSQFWFDNRDDLSDRVRCSWSKLTLNNIKYETIDSSTSLGDARKIGYLQSLFRHQGYFVAKKALNENKNFLRNWGGLYALLPCSEQPISLLWSSLCEFLVDCNIEVENERF